MVILSPLPESARQGKDDKETQADDVRCLGQPTVVLIEMSAPRGGEGSAVDGHSHEEGSLTSGTTKKERRSGSAKHSAGNAGGHNHASRHQSHLTYLSKQ